MYESSAEPHTNTRARCRWLRPRNQSAAESTVLINTSPAYRIARFVTRSMAGSLGESQCGSQRAPQRAGGGCFGVPTAEQQNFGIALLHLEHVSVAAPQLAQFG